MSLSNVKLKNTDQVWDRYSLVFVLFLVFNSIVFVAGLFQIVNLAYFRFQLNQFPLVDSVISNIIVGVITMSISLLGFIGAVRRNGVLLLLFSGTILIVMVFAICATIILYAEQLDRIELSEVLSTTFIDKYLASHKSEEDAFTIEEIHGSYDCCGLFGPADPYLSVDNKTLIESCCAEKQPNGCTKKYAFRQGCLNSIVEDEYWRRSELPRFLAITCVLDFITAQLALYIPV